MLGRTIAGRYKVTSLLGKGGFGAVFAATHTMTSQDVVLKVMRPEFAADPTQVKRFMNEARISSGLMHPNTVRVFDFGQTDDGLLYLVMERLHGEELSDILKRDAPLDPGRAMHIAIGLLKSLSEAHAAGLVHRDLKPGNVFLVRVHGEEEYVKLIDFGIAKSVESGAEEDLTRTGMAIGTPKYMSPEQGRAEALDGRSDLYALGVLLFEMLSGRLPFTAASAMQMILKHMQEPPPDLRTLAPAGLPPELAHVVMKSLAKSPWERFRDADEMREHLEQILEGMGQLHRRSVSSRLRAAALASSDSLGERGPITGERQKTGAQDDERAIDNIETCAVSTPASVGVVAAAASVAGAATMAVSTRHTPPSAGELAALAGQFDKQAASHSPTIALSSPDALDASTFTDRPTAADAPSAAVVAGQAQALLAAAEAVNSPSADATVAVSQGPVARPPPGVRPATPTRPAGPTMGRLAPRGSMSTASKIVLALLALVIIAGVVWSQLLNREERAAVERGAASAQAKLATKVRETDLAPRGQRADDRPTDKRPKSAIDHVRAAANAAGEAVREAMPGGDDDPKLRPLTSKEVDHDAQKLRKRLIECVRSKGDAHAAWTRVGAALDVAADGNVTAARVMPEFGEGDLADCFEREFGKLNLRGGRESSQTIDVYVAFEQPVSGRRGSKPASRAPKAPRSARPPPPPADGDVPL